MTGTTALDLGSPAHRKVPRLAIWSIVLAGLPLLLSLLYFTAPGDAESSQYYVAVLLAWNGIPIVWLASLAVGIVTLVRRNGRWRIAGIVAVVLPILELVGVLYFVARVLSMA